MNLALLLKVGLVLACPKPELVNVSAEKWTTADQLVFTMNKNFCEQKFADKSPCMITFVKKAPRTYRILCGRKRLLPPTEAE